MKVSGGCAMHKLSGWALLSVLVLLGGGAGAVCLPGGTKDFNIQDAPKLNKEIEVTSAAMAALVLDGSVGMAGFTQGPGADHPKRIFKQVVSAAWMAIPGSVEELTTPRGYVLVKNTLHRAEDYERLLGHCNTNPAPGYAGCTREAGLSQATLFKSDANINLLFASLNDRARLRSFERDLFAADGFDLERDLLLVVTDLQNNAEKEGAGQLGKFLSELLSEREETAVMLAPFRSIFSGSVYDLPGYEAGNFLMLKEKVQPFFIVAVGPPGVLQSFHEAFLRALSVQKLPLGKLVDAGLAQWPMMTTRTAGLPQWDGRLHLHQAAQTRSEAAKVSELPHPVEPGSALPLIELPMATLQQADREPIELARLDLGTFRGETAHAKNAPKGAPTRVVCWESGAGGQRLCHSDVSKEMTWTLKGMGGWFRGPEVIGPRRLFADWLSGLWGPEGDNCPAETWHRIPANPRAGTTAEGRGLRVPFGVALSLSKDENETDFQAQASVLLDLSPSDRKAYFRGDELIVEFDFNLVPHVKTESQVWLREDRGWHLDSSKVPFGRTKSEDKLSGLGDRLLGVGGLADFLRKVFSATPQAAAARFQSRHGVLVRFVD